MTGQDEPQPQAPRAPLSQPSLSQPSLGQKPAKVAKPRPRRRILRTLFAVAFTGVLATGVVGSVVGYHTYQRYAADLPSLDVLRHYQPRVMSRVYAGDSRLLSELATERRIFVPVSAIPDVVKQAFLSAEDQNFWTHRGVDPFAIARAIWVDVQNYGSGRRPIGASTITQQVAKNMLLTNEVSLSRKVRELILAVRIDQSMSKEHVLELYLNEIFLGLQSYGVAAAAQAYFNKSLDDLTLAEAAFLAALPKAPNNYNPFRFADAATARRNWVLDRMADDKAITPEQAAAAKAAPLKPAPFSRPETVAGGEWFSEEVRRQLVERFGADATTQGGLTVRTSMDPAMQTAADAALRKGLLGYDRVHGGWRGPVSKLDNAATLRTNWAARLALLPRPPGMLPDWRAAVVFDVSNDEAKLGWLDRSSGTPQARTGTLYLSDLSWARPVRPNGAGLGPAPRRMADVVQVGDVVMSEPLPGTPAQGRTPARPERVALRQVPQVQGALVSLDPATGRVLAMSGGWSFDTSQFNRATQAQRQPGSSFKPFVYLAALQANLSPSQRVLDAPFVQKVGREEWRPNNYGMTFNGPTSMRVALERSLNMVTIRLAERVGMEAVADNAKLFNVVDGMPLVLPASLGAVESTVLRQAAAYGGLAMGGRRVLPSMVDSVQDRDGKVLWRPGPQECRGCADPARAPGITDKRTQVADAQSVFQLTTMLQGAVQRGTGFAAGKGLGRPVAGKTGTSQESNDVWFVGYTPDLVTAVWVGFDNNTSLGEKETGGGVSAPIFNDYMATVLKGRPALQFRMPEGVRMLAWDSGAGRVTDAFKTDQEPNVGEPTIGTDGGGGGGGGSTGLTVSTGGPGVGVDSGMGGLY